MTLKTTSGQSDQALFDCRSAEFSISRRTQARPTAQAARTGHSGSSIFSAKKTNAARTPQRTKHRTSAHTL